MKIYQLRVFLLALVILAAASSSKAQSCAGCLDPAFGSGGTKYLTGMGNGQTVQYDMVIQSDGKIVALVSNKVTGATLIRLNTDGSLDTTFAGDGILETDWQFTTVLPYGAPHGLAIQVINGEERLVVAGSWTVSTGKKTQATMLRVDRYLSNGAVDTSFGSNATGTVVMNKPVAGKVSIQPTDNKIITVGAQSVVRLNENGTIDTGFGSNGEVATGQSGLSVKALADGSILIGGSCSQSNDTLMCVTKLNANGSSVVSFGTSGRAIANFYGRGSVGVGWHVDVDPVGNVIIGGNATPKNGSSLQTNFAAARFTSTGQLDPSFNGTGMVTYDFAGLNDIGHRIVVQPDGKLILTGKAQLSTSDTGDFALVRFNFDGSVDTSFGTNGRATLNFEQNDEPSSAQLWLDPSCGCQKLIMAGDSYSGASFARYRTQ